MLKRAMAVFAVVCAMTESRAAAEPYRVVLRCMHPVTYTYTLSAAPADPADAASRIENRLARGWRTVEIRGRHVAVSSYAASPEHLVKVGEGITEFLRRVYSDAQVGATPRFDSKLDFSKPVAAVINSRLDFVGAKGLRVRAIAKDRVLLEVRSRAEAESLMWAWGSGLFEIWLLPAEITAAADVPEAISYPAFRIWYLDQAKKGVDLRFVLHHATLLASNNPPAVHASVERVYLPVPHGRGGRRPRITGVVVEMAAASGRRLEEATRRSIGRQVAFIFSDFYPPEVAVNKLTAPIGASFIIGKQDWFGFRPNDWVRCFPNAKGVLAATHLAACIKSGPLSTSVYQIEGPMTDKYGGGKATK